MPDWFQKRPNCSGRRPAPLSQSQPSVILRKEVIQPHLPVRLPCYDLVPLTGLTFGTVIQAATSGAPCSGGLTGGVYKAREHIHRAVLMRDY